MGRKGKEKEKENKRGDLEVEESTEIWKKKRIREAERERNKREETRKKNLKMIRKKKLVEKEGEFMQGKETDVIRK